MRVSVRFPYGFCLDTQIVSVDMDIHSEDLTYRGVVEILARSFTDRVYKTILCDREIMVIIIVDNKRMSPEDRVRDGDKIVLMMPLEGG